MFPEGPAGFPPPHAGSSDASPASEATRHACPQNSRRENVESRSSMLVNVTSRLLEHVVARSNDGICRPPQMTRAAPMPCDRHAMRTAGPLGGDRSAIRAGSRAPWVTRPVARPRSSTRVVSPGGRVLTWCASS